MSTDYKSISEIAKDLNVSRQAIYQKLKSNKELSTSLQPFTVKQGKLTVYSLQGQNLIKSAFSSASVKQDVSIDSKLTDNDSKLIDSLTTTIEILKNQLEIKDNQIKDLSESVKTLTESNKALTVALQAAQALHGMDKQQQAIETTAEPKKQTASASSSSGTGTEQKKSKQSPIRKKPEPKNAKALTLWEKFKALI